MPGNHGFSTMSAPIFLSETSMAEIVGQHFYIKYLHI